MANQEPFPSDRDRDVKEQIPHSGVYFDEKPVRVFDNTDLDEAHVQGLLKTPDSPAPLVEEEKAEKAKKNKLGHLGIAGLAAGVAATGIFGATKLFGNSDNGSSERSDRQQTGTSQSANPPKEQEPTAPTAEVEPLEKASLVTVEQYPTVEDAVKQMVTLEAEVSMLSSNPGPDIETVRDSYFEALYATTPGEYQEGDRRQDLIDNRIYASDYITDANSFLVQLGSTDTNGDQLQYWFNQKVDKVVRTEGNTVYYTLKVESNYNDLPNDVAALYDELPGSDSYADITAYMTLDQQDGQWFEVDAGYEKNNE